jgi:hypothetical protein
MYKKHVKKKEPGKMNILNYFKESFHGKKARRIAQEYHAKINSFNLKNEGKIEFVNWDNPLVSPKGLLECKVVTIIFHVVCVLIFVKTEVC